MCIIFKLFHARGVYIAVNITLQLVAAKVKV